METRRTRILRFARFDLTRSLGIGPRPGRFASGVKYRGRTGENKPVERGHYIEAPTLLYTRAARGYSCARGALIIPRSFQPDSAGRGKKRGPFFPRGAVPEQCRRIHRERHAPRASFTLSFARRSASALGAFSRNRTTGRGPDRGPFLSLSARPRRRRRRPRRCRGDERKFSLRTHPSSPSIAATPL